MSGISTHVLDSSIGRPAAGMSVVLEIESSAGTWKEVGRGMSNVDGRIADLLGPGSFAEGTYRLTFDTEAYFRSRNVQGFYPSVTIIFRVCDPSQHHHIPLLLSPYGYSTYRGS
jgi:5-hydroxyisourate hydrolase